jgi:hypothetical protein
MFVMHKRFLGVLSGILLAAGLTVSAKAANMATPGSVNYIEGQVSLNGNELTSKSIGSAEVGRNQLLETGQGKAEILLTPGVFLRIGEHSAVRMISPELIDTQVELTRGRALVEVTQLLKNNRILVQDNGAATTLEKDGIYGFNADDPRIRVFDGKAKVVSDDTSVELKKGKELNLNGPLKAEKFDRKAAEKQDSLYQWSNLRSEYLAEASTNAAQVVVMNRGWYGPGWYWDPYWSMYSFLPGTGVLYSPFGYGFYSPFAYGYGYGYGGLRGYYGGGRSYHHPVIVGQRPITGISPGIGTGRQSQGGNRDGFLGGMRNGGGGTRSGGGGRHR